MITQKQREKHYSQNKQNLQYATLTRDYKPEGLDYVLPAGTIVQVDIYLTTRADLYIGGRLVDSYFPYDAAELLEDE